MRGLRVGPGVRILSCRWREVTKHIHRLHRGLNSLEIKLLFFFLFEFTCAVQSSPKFIRNTALANPQHVLLQRELLLTSSGTHVGWSNLGFQGVVLALTSLLNTVIELWFLTVARSTARGCVALRDCGFDNYVPFHCTALYFTRVKEPTHTSCFHIFLIG